MSLFMDGFDYFNSTTFLRRKWDADSNNPSFTNVGSGVFSYGRGATLDGNYINKTLPSNWQTIYLGYHIVFSTTLGNDSQKGINILDGTTSQINIRVTSDGFIKVYRNTTLLATGTHALSPNSTYWFAIKIYIHASAGTVTLNITGPGYDDVNDINLTGADTMESANAYATKIALSDFGAADIIIDNFHLYDGTDAAPWNALIPESRIYFYLPSGDGANTDFTASSGADYACMDENPTNDDTDYISSATPGHKNSVVIADIPSVTVNAVNLTAIAKRDDATARGLKVFSKISGTDYLGDEFLLGASYQVVDKLWLVSPATAAAWGEAEVNAAEWGVTVSS